MNASWAAAFLILLLGASFSLAGCIQSSASGDSAPRMDGAIWRRADGKNLSVQVAGVESIPDAYGTRTDAYRMDVHVDDEWTETYWVDGDGKTIRHTHCSLSSHSKGCERIDLDYSLATVPNPFGWIWARTATNQTTVWRVDQQSYEVVVEVAVDQNGGRTITMEWPGRSSSEVPSWVPLGTYRVADGALWPTDRTTPDSPAETFADFELTRGADLGAVPRWEFAERAPPTRTGKWLPGGDERARGHDAPDAVIEEVRKRDAVLDEVLNSADSCITTYSEKAAEPVQLLGLLEPQQEFDYLIYAEGGGRHVAVRASAVVTANGLLTQWNVAPATQLPEPRTPCRSFDESTEAQSLLETADVLDQILTIESADTSYGFSRLMSRNGSAEDRVDPGTHRKVIIPQDEADECLPSCTIITVYASADPAECRWARFRVPPPFLPSLDQNLAAAPELC